MRTLPTAACAALALAGCGAAAPDAVTARGAALALALAPAADTFLNSAFPDNNDGASLSIYTGKNGQGGLMRGLIRFDLPAGLQGRVTVSRVVLTMVTRGTGLGDAVAPTPATESLEPVAAAWAEGSGFGDGTTSNTVGQPCAAHGATWNDPDCASGVAWAGGGALAPSGTASVPGAVETPVVWDSDQGGAGMTADVQSWIDTPDANHGWLIASSTESGTAGQAQRFHSREAAGEAPTLVVTTACKSGLAEADGGCAAAPVTPDAAAGPPCTGGGGCAYSPAGAPGGGAVVAVPLLLAFGRPRRRLRARRPAGWRCRPARPAARDRGRTPGSRASRRPPGRAARTTRP
jgi:hypothetical protein